MGSARVWLRTTDMRTLTCARTPTRPRPQGANAAFEDCLFFTECLDACRGDLSAAVRSFAVQRKPAGACVSTCASCAHDTRVAAPPAHAAHCWLHSPLRGHLMTFAPQRTRSRACPSRTTSKCDTRQLRGRSCCASASTASCPRLCLRHGSQCTPWFVLTEVCGSSPCASPGATGRRPTLCRERGARVDFAPSPGLPAPAQVAFTRIPYHDVIARAERQDRTVETIVSVAASLALGAGAVAVLLLGRHARVWARLADAWSGR